MATLTGPSSGLFPRQQEGWHFPNCSQIGRLLPKACSGLTSQHHPVCMSLHASIPSSPSLCLAPASQHGASRLPALLPPLPLPPASSLQGSLPLFLPHSPICRAHFPLPHPVCRAYSHSFLPLSSLQGPLPQLSSQHCIRTSSIFLLLNLLPLFMALCPSHVACLFFIFLLWSLSSVCAGICCKILYSQWLKQSQEVQNTAGT